MKEFEIIEQTLPVIKINFEEIKENLEVSLDKYKSLIVTKETLKEIKQTQKSLAGLKIKIDDYRKSIKKEMSVPIAEFEMKCKELYKLVEEAEEPLKSGIKIYDDGVRENKRKLAQEHVQKQIQELGLIEKYANQLIILDSYSNLTSNDNATKLDINKRAKELFNRQKQELEIIELIKNTIKKKNEGISQKMKIEDFQDLIDDEGFMSLIDEFMKSHDLKDGEEFTIGNGSIYKIENDILYYHQPEESVLFKAEISINKLNTATIKKLHWKPVKAELFYTVNFKFEDGVTSDLWTDCGLDNMLRKRGLVFRTKEEAEKAFEKLRSVLNNVD